MNRYRTDTPKANILIVDDTPDNLRLLSKILTEQGYEVAKALNGQMALTAVQASLPDLILLDINMPDMSGYEVCERLKANDQTKDIPVIFLSALDEWLDKAKAFRAGGVSYVIKPFKHEEVLVRVENQLKLTRLRSSLQKPNVSTRHDDNSKAPPTTTDCDRKQDASALLPLPYSSSSLLQQTSPKSSTDRTDAPRANILIVDDTPDNLRLLSTILTQQGYEVGKALSGEMALKSASSAPPDLILLDILMPEMNGYEVCEHLKADRKTRDIPIIFISALDDVFDKVRAFTIGGVDYITKPFQDEEVLARVQTHLNIQSLQKALRQEQEKSERLLLNILPETIVQELKHNQTATPMQYDEASFLFSDIVGFAPSSSSMPPTDVVKLLNQVFSTFDQLTEQHGVEKIRTIGDAYFVVGGVPKVRPDHAEAIADMALDMQQAISQFHWPNNESLALRIGINTGGPVVAAVIGTRKFAYDVWGDAVNIACRMENQGIPGRIEVTAATYERLKDKYKFQERGAISVKGRGEMTTYWLIGRKHDASRQD
jgi:adenylate cyclase